MTDKAPVSILTASPKIHYMAVIIFAILFVIGYGFIRTDYFKSLNDYIGKWIPMFSSRTQNNNAIDDSDKDSDKDSDDDSIEPGNTTEPSMPVSRRTINTKGDGSDKSRNDEEIQDILSPF